jgi:hypothetical protein
LLGAIGITFFGNHFRSGWEGVAKSIVFACFMLAIAAFLTKRKVRLAL